MTAPHSRLTRRSVLRAAGGLALTQAAILPAPAFAQNTLRPVKFMLSWLANGSTSFPYIARNQGLFKKYGLDVTIARGFGSVATAQTVGGGQFDFGMSFAGATILSVTRGLPLVSLGSFSYDSLAGTMIRADGPINTPKDLEGRKVGYVAAGADTPYWPAFVKNAKIDASKVTLVQCDARIIEQALVSRQVDAITATASSSLPIVMAMNEKCRFIRWANYGLRQYAGQLITRREILEKEPELCQAVHAAMFEGLAIALRDPEAATDIFLKEVPEAALAKNARENARISQGLMHYTVISPEAEKQSLGYCDMAALEGMVDMIMQYGGGTGPRPAVDTMFTNRFNGQVKLTPAEWVRVKQNNAEFAALLG